MAFPPSLQVAGLQGRYDPYASSESRPGTGRRYDPYSSAEIRPGGAYGAFGEEDYYEEEDEYGEEEYDDFPGEYGPDGRWNEQRRSGRR